MADKKPTVDDLRNAKQALADSIADQLAEFEAKHGVEITNVTANPRRVATADGDSHEWRGHVNVRLSL